MKKAMQVLCLAITTLASGSALADRVYITNTFDQGLKFSLRCLHHDHPGPWQAEYLNSGESRWYNIEGCHRYGIGMATSRRDGDREAVRYELHAHERYGLVYNRHRQIFDVRPMR